MDALDTLTPGDIFEVKLMKTPPAPVMLVMEAVCIFMQIEPVRKTHPETGQMYNDWWATSIKLLSQPGFLNKLKTYDKDKIKKKVIRKVAKYVAKPEFEPKRIMKASKAAGGLCSWVKALVDYDAVIKVVNPKKAALKDRRVRQALNMVINRTELRQFSFGVKPGDKNSPCEFISGPFVRSSPYYNATVPLQPTANLAKAEALLKSAGLVKTGGRWHVDGKPITLRVGMLSNLDNEAPDLLSQVSNQLGAAGFDRQSTKITPDEWDNSVMAGTSDLDLLIGKWSFGLVEEVNELFHSKGRQNIFRYENAAVDEVLQQYDDAVTDNDQRDAYHKLHTLLANDLPYLFLWKLDTKSAWRTEVRGNIVAPYFYFTEIDGWSVSNSGG